MYIAWKRRPSVPANCLLQTLANYSSHFCKKICMQALICVCTNVNIPGILHGKESQAFLQIACLKTSTIIARISAKKIFMQTFICICTNVNIPGILHQNESQPFLQIGCLRTSTITAVISAKKSACKHSFAFALM